MAMNSISDSEAQVMEVLWNSSPLSTEEIAVALKDQQAWQLATVKTLINRLLNKGAISAVAEGRRYLYSPVLRREDWVGEQSSKLLDRLFGGRLAPLLAQFSAQGRLKPSDVAELKRLLKDLDHD
ncbi:putative transcriptional regulator [Paucibacter oligotrophus]|uniref:Putative transcriptional regulator n=1 Tax=Roseateles oligotrophus TaxID=1769250 RepID=A0A840LJK8_9BURK|nr:BlaI/MecI/CopY family transcriptional regulator [Roseateles oligotrophus]MBB4845467.1 putative transcriptional regulator [Roseateles oligotrophus]